MLLRTINRRGNIVLVDYEKPEAKNIMLEKNSYVIKKMNYYGEDYGRADAVEENCDVSYEEIIPERVLVKNNHFAGISIQNEYDYYNGTGIYELRDSILLVGDKTYIKSGYDYSFDDHSRWDYTHYYLIERDKMEREQASEK